MPETPIRIVYDGDCPFCSRYVRLLRLRENFTVELVNARDAPDRASALAARGFDLDEGMLVEHGDAVYHGADAVWILASLSSRATLWNRFNAAIFRSRRLSALFYPLLRAGRNLVLRLLGRRPIAAGRGTP